jgi:hypothetical protein
MNQTQTNPQPPPTYAILATDYGQAFHCLRCGIISYNNQDVQHRYCASCKLFHDQGPLPPLTLAEFQVIYNRLFRYLTAEDAMRKITFKPGDNKRQEKLTASTQALADLQIIKNVLKQLFQINFPESGQAAPVQPPLLDLPPAKPGYN